MRLVYSFDTTVTKLIGKLSPRLREPLHVLGLYTTPLVWGLILIVYATLTDLTPHSLWILGLLPLASLSKLLFRRRRPPTMYAGSMRVKSYSFPSSHAYTAALAGSYFAWMAATNGNWPLSIVLMLLIIVIGVSRVFLGAHYPSDVVAGWLTGLGFGMLAWIISTDRVALFDSRIIEYIIGLSTPWLDQVMSLVTHGGDTLVIAAIVIALVLYFVVRKRYWLAAFIGTAVASAGIANTVLKQLFARARPEPIERFALETSYSFPSGHAMGSAALAFTIVYLCWRKSYRRYVLLIAGLYVVAIGVSRIYLGAHFPSDVVAGWLAALLWIGLVTAAFRKKL